MSTFDIVTVIAVILFARLGIRLVRLYIKYKNETKDDNSSE